MKEIIMEMFKSTAFWYVILTILGILWRVYVYPKWSLKIEKETDLINVEKQKALIEYITLILKEATQSAEQQYKEASKVENTFDRKAHALELAWSEFKKSGIVTDEQRDLVLEVLKSKVMELPKTNK